ncbi:MAG TPA: LacI family DNA-binding transcriptional regulator [Chthoniobacteraceae bacterium]|jgi:DNA-binding LacI/PurR family transcriptional regulator
MKQIQTVRMAEIAQRLGVASSTVSRALRGDSRIGAEMKQRVRELAEKMAYRPNPLVSALMANRRRRGGKGEVDVIALITNYGGKEDWRTKDVCRWEFNGVQRRAGELGFRVEVFPLDAYGGDAERLATTLRVRGIRGLLLGFSRQDSEPRFPTPGFAAAGLSAYFRSATVDRANFHGFYNVQLALERMLAFGYRRPALVAPELNNHISNNHWSGAFLDWQRKLPKRDRCEPYIPAGSEAGGEFDEWLDANRPDSLLVYKVPVRAYLARRRWRAPEEIGLAYLYRTSDEMGGAAGIDGNLSAVGAAAVDLVVEKLNANSFGISDHPKEVLIKGMWRDGVTLRKVSAEESRPARRRNKGSTLFAP